MRAVIGRLRPDEAERSVVVVPARVERHDLGLALAERARRAGPAAQLDVAGLIELGLIEADQRLEPAGGKLLEQALIPGDLWVGVAISAGEMRHAAAREDDGLEPERGHGARHRLAKGITALHGGLRP